MFTLYFFGKNIEYVFQQISFTGLFLVLYLTGIVVASIPAMVKHRNHSYYMALGASGGVSAILFASVYYFPWARISFFGIEALGIPGIIFGVLYLAYSAYMDKKGNDNIGHDAHFWGAVYGFVFALLADPSHGRSFLNQIMHPSFQ
jgi:membrane associated rhomboid family serine protease